MGFNSAKKQTIILYLLEKIDQKDERISEKVSETFDVNQNTIHRYINELLDDIIIKRIKRGQYELIKNEYVYELSRSKGELDSDTYAFDKCLHEHIKDLPENVVAIWSYSFSEMINNVMDHSGAEHVRIEIEQDYLNTWVVIGDDGVGIFRKIKEYFKFSTLDEAINELFKGKLTTDPRNHSGEGIFFSSKLMDSFIVFSDDKIFTNNKYDDSFIADLSEKGIKGTGVLMGLSNYTNKRAKDVFDQYADVDGGFTKTSIPLKNMFGSSPVSRSQAKRLCNRLDRFEEVVLDFAGITWMGQGFAHQLFVVFANEHPNIKLIPINMNEDVTRMHVHVLRG